MLYRVSLLGRCELWYSVHCSIAQWRIPLFILWSCVGGCLYLVCHQSVLVYICGHTRQCPWSCTCLLIVFYSLSVIPVSKYVSSFRRHGSCRWRYPKFYVVILAVSDAICLIISVKVSMSSSSCSLSNGLCNHGCSSILCSSILSYPLLRHIQCFSLSFCGHFQRWHCWWLIHVWRCLACVHFVLRSLFSLLQVHLVLLKNIFMIYTFMMNHIPHGVSSCGCHF